MQQDGIQMDAQDLMIQDIMRLKENDKELYDLDRKKTELIMELNTNLKEVVVEQKVIKKDVNELKDKMSKVETSTAATNADVNNLKSDMREVKEDMKEVKQVVTSKKWQPKDIAVIVVAVLALCSSVITTLITALIK